MSAKGKKFNFASKETETINSRFIVKASMMNKDSKSSIMIIVTDVLDGHFKIQYFTDPEEAQGFVRLLQAIN